MAANTTMSFQGYYDQRRVSAGERFVLPIDAHTRQVITQDRTLSYRFHTHFHPYTAELVQDLVRGGLRLLLDADTTAGSRFHEALLTPAAYAPTNLVASDRRPLKDLDFEVDGAYAVYNWELFFHVPLTVAIHLSRNQRYAEAQRWLHFLFDPTDNSAGPTPERFWKVKPFRHTDVRMIEEVLTNLSTNMDPDLRARTAEAIGRWREAPFRPFLVARARPASFMFKVVMVYLDNLIAWGDSLFRQDTGESVNEAAMLYVLASQILGPRPQRVPLKRVTRPETYQSLKNKKLDEFSNALVEMETELPFSTLPLPSASTSRDDGGFQTLRSIGRTLYFCVPHNERLLGYWDTVADRLFKIRNSLNLQGVFRQLALFDPPIDPGLLARAVAAGVDVSAAVSGLNQPLPLVRFGLLVQKASEICQEVKSLGANLLAAMEKDDNEALSAMRARHERAVLGLAEVVKYGQYQEAVKAREGVEKTLANAAQRYVYYERLLGRSQGDISLPGLDALDTDSLKKFKLKATEPTVAPRDVPVDIAQGAEGLAGGHRISSHERQELEKMSSSQTASDAAVALDTLAAVYRLIPEFGIDALPFGIGGEARFGGEDIAAIIQLGASVSRGVAARFSYEANLAAKIGGYARREQEWAFQSNLAAGEITQSYKQLRAAQIREAVAKREWENHQQQMRNAEEVERFLTDERTGKKTGQALYTWMRREVRGLYTQCFQFAFDVARKAERALQRELGDKSLTYLKYDYPSGREGLLAGERLHLDIKRMEMAYHDLNRREYELTQHVSLLQLDPVALMRLRTTGRCTFTVPEALYDLHCPGHYFRRIKSVAVSVPGVAGPHVGVHCTLTLLRSTIRTKPTRAGATEYAREGTEDDRFEDHFGSAESIVTSSAQADSGLFETNLRDERYLPFEGAGAESQWQIELPSEVKTFDHKTIADVVLHVRYTAREGGAPLRTGASFQLKELLKTGASVGNVRLLSVRHEFPVEWARFKNAPPGTTVALALPLRQEHYPYWGHGHLGPRLDRVEATPSGGTATVTLPSPLPAPTDTTLNLELGSNALDDLWVLLTWKWA
jgi:hypothetical protein